MEIEIKTKIKPEVLSREIIIESQEDYSSCGDVLKNCKNKIKDLEIERKTYTSPLDESKKLIMAKFKETINPIKEYIDKINSVMSKWYLEEEKKRREEQKRLEEEAIKNAPDDEPDIEVPVVESVKTDRGKVATSTAVEYNEPKIIDESKIPRQYLDINLNRIKKAINDGGVKQISGIEIIKKARIISR